MIEEAKNPSTNPERLSALASHPKVSVRAAVAANPNTPPAVLALLGAQFPELIWRNPVLPMLLLENPNLFDSVPMESYLLLIRSTFAPEDFLWQASKRKEKAVRHALAMLPHAPVGLLEVLSLDPAPEVRKAVALHSKTPSVILERLAADRDTIVRVSLTQNLATPVRILEGLAGDPHIIVSRAAARACESRAKSRP